MLGISVSSKKYFPHLIHFPRAIASNFPYLSPIANLKFLKIVSI